MLLQSDTPWYIIGISLIQSHSRIIILLIHQWSFVRYRAHVEVLLSHVQLRSLTFLESVSLFTAFLAFIIFIVKAIPYYDEMMYPWWYVTLLGGSYFLATLIQAQFTAILDQVKLQLSKWTKRLKRNCNALAVYEHAALTNLSSSLTQLYGYQLLIFVMSSSLDMTRSLFDFVAPIPDEIEEIKFLTTAAQVLGAILDILPVFVLIRSCENAAAEVCF